MYALLELEPRHVPIHLYGVSGSTQDYCYRRMYAFLPGSNGCGHKYASLMSAMPSDIER